MKIIIQLITICVSILIIFVILNTPMIAYMAHILGIVITLSLLYFFVKKRIKKDQEIFTGTNIEVFTIILVILLTIFLTGGLSSPIFFLMYFLIFGIAFLFEPVMVFVFLVFLIALFIQQYLDQNLFSYWLPFLMLLSVAPISFFFGKEFKRREKIDQEIEKTTQSIIHEAKELKKELTDQQKTPKTSEHLKNIIDESSNLRKSTK